MRPVSAFQLLVSIWALVAVPAMCSGGILTHPCEPEELHPCHPTHGPDESVDHEHESDCLLDPCQVIGLRAGDRSNGSLSDGFMVFAAITTTAFDDDWIVDPSVDGSPPHDGARRPSVWPAASCTVLLI